MSKLRVCPTDDTTLQRAYALPITDYEDAVQAAAAAAAGLDYIITRNLDDYAGSPVPVLVPGELLRMLTPPPAEQRWAGASAKRTFAS